MVWRGLLTVGAECGVGKARGGGRAGVWRVRSNLRKLQIKSIINFPSPLLAGHALLDWPCDLTYCTAPLLN